LKTDCSVVLDVRTSAHLLRPEGRNHFCLLCFRLPK